MSKNKLKKPAEEIEVKQKKKERLVYCGPNFNGEIQQYSIFIGGIPHHVKHHGEACPSFLKLFVDKGKLAETRKNINVPGKLEYELYKNVKDYQEKLKTEGGIE